MITSELKTYVQQQLGAGVAKDVIKQNLAAKGWDMRDVDDAFIAIESSQSAQTVTPAPVAQASVQTPIQDSVQPVASTSHKGVWMIAVVILLLLSAGSAYAAYQYDLFAVLMPVPAVSPVATITAPITDATTTPLASAIDAESASITTTSTMQTAEQTEAAIQQQTARNMGKAAGLSSNLKEIQVPIELYFIDNGSYPKFLSNLIPQYIAKSYLVKTINDKNILYAYSADGKHYHMGVDINLPYTQDFSGFKYDKDFNSKAAGYVNGFNGQDPIYDLSY